MRAASTDDGAKARAMKTRTLYSRPSFNWFAILISLVFVVIGVWMIRTGNWLGWLEVGLFGFGLVVLIVANLLKLNRLHFNPEGFQTFQTLVSRGGTGRMWHGFS